MEDLLFHTQSNLHISLKSSVYKYKCILHILYTYSYSRVLSQSMKLKSYEIFILGAAHKLRHRLTGSGF